MQSSTGSRHDFKLRCLAKHRPTIELAIQLGGMMRPVTRRNFIGGAAAVAAVSSTKFSFGMPLGLMPGIQLYSVRQQMAPDFEGTLASVREAGFLEVESAALPKKPAAEIRKALHQAGLNWVS